MKKYKVLQAPYQLQFPTTPLERVIECPTTSPPKEMIERYDVISCCGSKDYVFGFYPLANEVIETCFYPLAIKPDDL